MAAHQSPPSLGFSRQEHWSGLPFPSPVHESEKWKWSRSVVSDSSWPHGLQPTRLLCSGDFPGKSTGVGCHCLLAQVPGCIVNILYGCYPALGYVQNCWVVVCCRLIFLMPPGIIPALTIYKVPTATPHVEMQLHFTACQNNRPFWDHCSFFGFWENTILRSMVTCQVQASSRCFFPKWFYYREGLPWNRMFYRN